MIKKKSNFLILFGLLFSIFLFPKDVFAKEINAFRFNLDEDNFIDSSTLIRLQELVHKHSTGTFIDFDNSSWYVLRKDGNYYFRVICSNGVTGWKQCDSAIPLSSYTDDNGYTLEIPYMISFNYSENFEFLEYEDQLTFYGDEEYRYDVLYSSDNYDNLKIDSDKFNDDPDSAFSIDFPIVASNGVFALQNKVTLTKDKSDFKYLSIQGKPDYQNGNSSKSYIILPFDEERNILLTDDSYGSSKKWTFNSNDFTAVKISYDVLQGTVEQRIEKEDLVWWEKFIKFFGYKPTESKIINVDNFIYTVSSSVNLPAPQRFYSTNGKKYKKLPSDFSGANTNFYTKLVDTLNYDDGVRKGYILIDLSSLPADTEVTFEIEYSTLSLDLKGIEKTDDIDSLTEFDFSNYYGVALVPKFDYLTSYYRYPIYYQGSLLFGSLYNDDIESLDKTKGWKVDSPDKFSKFLFDLTGHQSAVEQGLARDYAYLFIKNLNFGKENNTAKIKYNPQNFEILTFSSGNSSVQASDGHSYWSPVWDEDDIDFGSVDEDGSVNGIGPPAGVDPVPSLFPTTLEEVLAMIPDLFKDMINAFGLVGTIFTSALSSFPPIITTGLYSVFILGILILIIKCLK